MALKSAGILRFLLALVCLQLASACGGDDKPPPQPPPEDTTAPTTRANPVGGAVTAPVSVTLTCEDRGGSGCAATHYTTDGSTPTQSSPKYTAPISISATTTLKFFSVDGKGNAEAVKTETYTFSGTTDTTPPTVSASPAGGSYGGAQTVTLTCNDGAGSGCASIRYTTDGSTPTTASAQYTAPLTVSANTTLKFFATDAAGNASAVVTETYVITVDTAPPTVTANPVGGVYNAAQTVTLTCNDGTGSGCASIRYTTDGSNPTASSTQYTGPVTISANAALKFLGIDNAGNTSSVRTESYVIDTVAPTVSANPRGGAYGSARTVTLSCTDLTGCASIRYTTDGSTPTASSTQYSAPISIPANTTLKFLGIDNAGNTSAVVTETYVIDTVAPTVSASPVGGTYNTAQSVALSCNDGAGSGCASIRYTTDGSTPTAASTQYSAALSISANTSLKFIGIDNAGNTSSVRTETYVIDTVAPTVSASPVGGTYNTAQSVALSCNDGTGTGCASIRYTTDGSTPTAASTQYSAAISISANTALKFIGIDNAGNLSSVRTETYVIDTVAPTVSASPVGGTYNTTQSVTLSCNDGTGTGCAPIRYTTDGSTPTASSTQYSAPISISANTTLKFLGIDNAGNTSAVSTETYVIDTVAPTVAANPAGGTYTSEQSVVLTCDDGAGTGCASIRYTTDGSTPTITSAVYTDPLSIAANTALKFLGIDNAGNVSTVHTESYVIDTAAPTVSANPTGNTYNAPVNVTLTCNDGSGSGCASIRYTTDGSVPTASSAQYTAPITISATTTLQFIGIDNAGNVSPPYAETYTLDTQAPTTSASPPGGVYGPAQSVSLSCNDNAGSGCAATYYTVDGSTPTTSSTQYSGPITISAKTTLKFFSVDIIGNTEAVKTQQYFIGTLPSDTSAQIAAVRAAAAGAINLPIQLALVTYVKPPLGTDAPGFFLQAEQAGPAVFIAVDPGTLTPVPMAGDRVSLVATQKAAVATMVHVTAISGYVVEARGEPVEPLRAEVSMVDLPANLANYESELISISGTLLTAFGASGAGHTSSSLSTLGTPTGTNLVLRLPITMQDQLDLAPTCSVTAKGPLWRFNTAAQTTTYAADDLTVLSCAAPKVLSAASASPTSVLVRFDRRIDPASVQANGGQFTFNNGLSATAATAQTRDVLLTTVAQTGGQSYTVAVAPSVHDTRGTSVDAAANTATFTGFQAPATLRITEANPNITNSRDLIELVAVQGGSVGNFTLVQDTGVLLATLPNVQVATGDIIVVHLAPTAANGDAPGSETVSKSEHPAATYAANYNTAWDFHGGTTGLSFSNRVIRVKDAVGATQDAVAFAVTSGTPPGAYPGELQALQAEGLWLPANCGGSACTYTSTPTAVQVSAIWTGTGTARTGNSVRRSPGADTNMASDWSVGANSLGAPNP
jgi:hypothetical protein